MLIDNLLYKATLDSDLFINSLFSIFSKKTNLSHTFLCLVVAKKGFTVLTFFCFVFAFENRFHEEHIQSVSLKLVIYIMCFIL